MKNEYNYLNIANIINDKEIDKINKDENFMKIYDIDFLMSNYQYLKVYIDNVAYQIEDITEESHGGFQDSYISMEEIRKTKRENRIIRPFGKIEKDGLYVKICEIKYDDTKNENIGDENE